MNDKHTVIQCTKSPTFSQELGNKYRGTVGRSLSSKDFLIRNESVVKEWRVKKTRNGRPKVGLV